MTAKTLRGDRCRCMGCLEYFNSTFAFDKHRRGKHPERACLTAEQMREAGFGVNQAGFWISSNSPDLPRGGAQEPRS